MENKNIKIAIVQQSAPHLNLEAALVELEKHAKQIANEGAELAVFGEGWLTGYPVWFDHLPEIALWDHPATKRVYARLWQNSLAVDSAAMQKVLSILKRYDLVACLGFNEQTPNGTLYNSFIIAEGDQLLNHHRKLVPTYTERLVHKPGDARGLRSVETRLGKISGLICWEHWMPLSRQKLHEDGEAIHLALWPTVHEMHQIASRQYAFEGRCFVVAAGQTFRASQLPEEFELPEKLKENPDQLLMQGGSCVIAPNGSFIQEPDFLEKPIIYSSFNLSQLLEERMTLEVTGHYARPDLFEFGLKE